MDNKLQTANSGILRAAVLAALALAALPAQADEAVQDSPEAEHTQALQEVKVKGARVQGGAPAAEKINREQIDNQMIRDTRDLVRYSPDVGIVDNGRHLKGFAMRGVEGNRVGVSIDGVNLPDFQENSLYARYGNFNSSRPSIDPELVRNIDIVKSADSFSYGSGNLGGGVNYRTLSAADVVSGDNPFGGMVKSGYATRNREWVNTVAAAYDGEDLEALALYSQRYGHNFKSKGNGEDIYGDARGIPDPSEHRYHSYLGKLAYRFSPQHRAGVTVSGQQGKNNVEEKSYAVFGWRDAEDTNRRLNANVFYEWTPQESRLSRLKTEFDYAKTSVGALTQNGSFKRDSWFGPITGKEDAYEFKDRNMKSDFKRLTLTADLTPFEAFGSHRLRLKAFGSQSDFKNVNHDTNKYGLDSWYSIQNPTRTKQYGFSLLDNVKWNDTFSGYLGLRYDHTKIKPQDFNLPCPNCTKEPLRDSTFAGWSGTLGLNAKITPTWQAGYHLSSGYRVPTASEMYFSFDGSVAGHWRPNPNLQAERSLSHTLNFKGQNETGLLDISIYQTNYRKFLSEKENIIETRNDLCDPYAEFLGYCKSLVQTPVQQMVNLDKARVRGVEVKGRLNLGNFWSAVDGLSLTGGVGYSKGKLSDGSSLMSIQPLKGILGLNYEQPEGRWGVFGNLTYTRGKKAEDTKYWKHTFDFSTRRYNDAELLTYKWLNQSAAVFDLYGYVRPVKNLTVRAGIYNLFDRKYNTWDTMRGLNEISPAATNAVDKDGKGLERYYAPGRNYAVSLEYKF